MKTRRLYGILITLGLLFCTQQVFAVVKTSVPEQGVGYYLEISPEDLLSKSVQTLHKESGKSFTFKERLALRLIKRQLKKSDRSDLDVDYEEAKLNTMTILGFSLAVLAFIVFLLSIGSLSIGSLILFSIISLGAKIALRKGSEQIENSGGREKGKNLVKAGKVLRYISAISLAIYVLVLIILLISYFG